MVPFGILIFLTMTEHSGKEEGMLIPEAF